MKLLLDPNRKENPNGNPIGNPNGNPIENDHGNYHQNDLLQNQKYQHTDSENEIIPKKTIPKMSEFENPEVPESQQNSNSIGETLKFSEILNQIESNPVITHSIESQTAKEWWVSAQQVGEHLFIANYGIIGGLFPNPIASTQVMRILNVIGIDRSKFKYLPNGEPDIVRLTDQPKIAYRVHVINHEVANMAIDKFKTFIPELYNVHPRWKVMRWINKEPRKTGQYGQQKRKGNWKTGQYGQQKRFKGNNYDSQNCGGNFHGGNSQGGPHGNYQGQFMGQGPYSGKGPYGVQGPQNGQGHYGKVNRNQFGHGPVTGPVGQMIDNWGCNVNRNQFGQ